MGRRVTRYLRLGTLCGLCAGSVGLTGLASSAGASNAVAPTPSALAVGAIGVTELGGGNRFATAAKIAERAFPFGSSTAVVVSGATANLSDSLAASYLADTQDAGKGAPILLVDPTGVPAETSAALSTLGVTRVIVVGGTGAVSSDVATALSDGGKVAVTRVFGTDRFVTADDVDLKAGPTMSPMSGTVGGMRYAIVADGQDQDLSDALGAAPVASSGPFPVFLVNGATGRLSSADLSIMSTDQINGAIIVGGTAAVGAQVGTQLGGAGIVPIREAGPNRSATAEALANFAITTLGFSATHLNIASGDQAHLADSLAGGPLGGSQRAPTLITSSVTDPGSVVSFVSAHASTETTADLLGGPGSVAPTAVAAIASPGPYTAPGGPAGAETEAAALLANPIVPPGSVPVASPPAAPASTVLDQPALSPRCDPYIDDADYWVVPSTTAAAVDAYLLAHPTVGTVPPAGPNGQGGTTNGAASYYVLTEVPINVGEGTSLVFTVAPLGNGSAGIRADGLVVDSTTGCLSAGVGP